MRLKKITLNNIRSYKNQEVEFSEGSTLLSGDIGSGKTSILLGIEFALFGLQPGQRGNSLLRNGEVQGGVIIEFTVDNKEIKIERTLKKAKTISQDYCSIEIDGIRSEISVTELKNRVLDLLNYPKEFSKKQNLLYKFTVYTPQEEMKQIIIQDPESRTNTLRHVFGIDKYKKILENISIVTGKIREEKRVKEGMIINLERDKSNLLLKETELQTKNSNLVSIDRELFLKIESRKKIEEEKETILEKVEEKRRLEQEIDKTKIMISNKNETLIGNNKLKEQLKLEIANFDSRDFNESEILQLEQDLQTLRLEKTKLEEANLEIVTQISSLTLKNQENEETKTKINHMDICPTCLQDVEDAYKSNVVNKYDSDTSSNVTKINELAIEKKMVTEKIETLNQEVFIKEKSIEELKLLKVKLQGISEKKLRLEELERVSFSLQGDLDLLNGQIDSLKTSVFELSKFENIFQDIQRRLEESLQQERFAEIKVAELKREIEVFSSQIQELNQRILETEQVRIELNRLTELESWLSKEFIFLVSSIEKNVMVKLKSEFSKVFAEWFSMLVSDTFHVTLDDNFTPVVEQYDYELDYEYLSGGERTAIALAYRLALNQVINSLLSKIKTKGFVILDEPTDGFSAQQLDKMREVLDQLNVDQLIIVSHEQKMEGFVENVIRFSKENGVSQKV